MIESYGLPAGTAINYGAPGFPDWVYTLGKTWALQASTYAGHQESERPDIGCAPNPDHLNRGIDWTGDPQHMLSFAQWLRDHHPAGSEMVIYQDPRTGEQVWYPGWVDFSGDLPNHTDHVHTRFSESPLSGAAPPPPLSRADGYAVAIIREGQRRGITPRGIQIALATALVESNLTMYANSNVPDSLNYPHDAVGDDHDSTGLFQQRQAWGPLSRTMDAACSAGLFFDGGDAGQRGLTDFDYNNEANTPGFYAQAVQVSAFPDRYDERFGEAVALYDRLAGVAPQPQPEEDWMADPELARMIRDLHAMLCADTVPSTSRYGDPSIKWLRRDMWQNDDGFLYDMWIERRAAYGDAKARAQIQKAADAGDAVAQNFLTQLDNPTPPTTPSPTPTPQPTPTPTPQPQSNGATSLTAAVAQFKAALDRLIG